MDRHLHRIVWCSPVDEDGTGDRVYLGKVQRGDVGQRRVLSELPAGGIQALELDGRAGGDGQYGWDRMIPPEVMVRAMHGVVIGLAHGLLRVLRVDVVVVHGDVHWIEEEDRKSVL